METFLFVLMVVTIVFAVWAGIGSLREMKKNRRKLQERMEEFDKAAEAHVTELQRVKLRVSEAIAETAKHKRLYDSLLKQHDDLRLGYQRAKKERDDLKAKCGALMEKRDELLAEIRRMKGEPVDAGEPAHHDQPGEPANKPLPEFKVDFDEMRRNYEELAKNYEDVSQRFENPSKTYLVNHIVKAYNVKSRTALAKVLGVSHQAINKMLK